MTRPVPLNLQPLLGLSWEWNSSVLCGKEQHALPHPEVGEIPLHPQVLGFLRAAACAQLSCEGAWCWWVATGTGQEWADGRTGVALHSEHP